MVYGLSSKPTQGYYVDFEVLDGVMDAIRLIDDSRDEGGKPLVRMSGRAIDPTHVPTRVVWKDRKKQPLADFDGGPFLSVSDRAKALIERFEPGVHQFLPVEFFDIDGELQEKRWFFICCNRLDTIDREHVRGYMLLRGWRWRSTQDWLRDRPDEIPADYDISQPCELVFNKGQIGSAHIWIDKHLTTGIFVSDEFDVAYDEAGMTGRIPNRRRRKTV